MIDIIIFSKDRPMQLEACLRSIRENFKFDYKVYTFIKYSSPFFEKGYNMIDPDGNFGYHWGYEVDFQDGLRLTLEWCKSDNILFFVDDDIVLREFTEQELESAIGYQDYDTTAISLRMHPKVYHCPLQDVNVDIPEFNNYISDGVFDWDWTKSENQHTLWGYPHPIDSQIYKKEYFMKLIEGETFNNCNTLEAIMNRKRDRSKPLMLGFNKPVMVNIDNNFVKDGADKTAILLNEQFLKGKRIDLAPYKNKAYNATHIKEPYTFL